MNTPATPTKLRRPCDLKRHHTGQFFDVEAMRCFGDTMHNFSLRQPRLVECGGVRVMAYELARLKPVRNGLSNSNWLHAQTFAVLPGAEPVEK